MIVAAVACTGQQPGEPRTHSFDLDGAVLAVGSKDFTEQLVLGEIAVHALEAAGATVDNRVGLQGSQNVRALLLAGELDLYWEYTGTAWTTYLERTARFDTPTEQYEAVATADLQNNGIRWLTPAPFENSYAIAATPTTAGNIETLSDLASLVREDPDAVEFCAAQEFLHRPDGLPGLQDHYDFELSPDRIHLMDLHAIYPAVARGQPCNFGEVFSTNGRLAELDLTILDDDRTFFPYYRPAITLRTTTLQDHPDIAPLFQLIASHLDRDEIVELNRQVEVEGRHPSDVARAWVATLLDS